MSTTWHEPDDGEVAEILKSAKNVAIVGISDNPEKASYGVAQWLMKNTDYELFFVNPRLETLFGKKVYKSVAEIPVSIDIMDLFRKSGDLPINLEDALIARPKVFWMQLGIRNQEVAEKVAAAGMIAIQDRCIKIEAEKRGMSR